MKNRNAVISQITEQELSRRFDANDTLFLARQIEYVRAKTFGVVYPDLKARNLIPIATDIPESVETYVYMVSDTVGKAAIVAIGTDDLPRIDVLASERTGKVRQIGDSYGWSLNEMAEAARLNIPLSERKATAAREAIERAIDEVLSSGTTSHPKDVGKNYGITGLINNADVVAQGIINPANDPWSTSPTAGKMLADLNTMMNTIVNSNNQAYIPDTILFAPSEFAILASTPVGTDNNQMTVLNSFLLNNPYIKNVDQWYRLTGAGSGAGGATNRAVVYKRDPSVLEGVVPMDFRAEAPQARNLEFVVPCRARCGGVSIYQPAAVRYVDFIPTA